MQPLARVSAFGLHRTLRAVPPIAPPAEEVSEIHLSSQSHHLSFIDLQDFVFQSLTQPIPTYWNELRRPFPTPGHFPNLLTVRVELETSLLVHQPLNYT